MRLLPDTALAASGRIRALLIQRNAEIHAYMGELDGALAAIERAVTSGLIDVAWLELCPLFDDLRADPRYAVVHATLTERAAGIRDALRRDPDRPGHSS